MPTDQDTFKVSNLTVKVSAAFKKRFAQLLILSRAKTAQDFIQDMMDTYSAAIEGKLDENIGAVTRLKAENLRLQAELSRLEEDHARVIENWKSRFSEFNQERQQLTSILDDTQAKNEDLKSEIEQLNNTLDLYRDKRLWVEYPYSDDPSNELTLDQRLLDATAEANNAKVDEMIFNIALSWLTDTKPPYSRIYSRTQIIQEIQKFKAQQDVPKSTD